MKQLRDKSFSEFDIRSFKNKCYYDCNVCLTALKDCYLHGNDCIIMQLIVSSHANCVIESLLLKKDCPKV